MQIALYKPILVLVAQVAIVPAAREIAVAGMANTPADWDTADLECNWSPQSCLPHRDRWSAAAAGRSPVRLVSEWQRSDVAAVPSSSSFPRCSRSHLGPEEPQGPAA